MNIKTIKKLYVQWMATVDQGKQVEFLEATDNGEEVEGGLEIARIFADESDIQWLEIYMNENAVRIPLSEIKRALQYAEQTVRSEKHYERQNNDAE